MGLKENLHKQKLKYQGTKFAPVFNALHTFLFVPDETTHSGAHIRDAADLKRIMNMVIISLVPCLLFGMWNTGYQHFSQLGEDIGFFDTFVYGAMKVLPIVVVSYTVGLGIEFLFAALRNHEVNEGFLVTGMLVPLIVPVDIPLWMLAVAVAFGVVIGKEVFGGTGMNILNPALTIRAFLFFAYPSWISGDKVWVADAKDLDAISGETILGALASNEGLVKHGAEASVNIGDRTVSMLDMLIGTIPGSIGETSVIAIAIGALILILTGIASWRIMFSMLLGGGLVSYIFNLWGVNELMQFPWYQQLMVGGFAFGTVFMATDPVSAAQTNKGKWIYGFLAGAISILVRVFNPAFPEGVMMAILLMNVFAPLIDHYVIQGNIKQRENRLKLKNA
ncbi:MAG: NADH:ubiquinone reductase (Na(+)-transporting) subunit B [Flavobacteriales bacterium]|nr:NADH:ubiquinone reductase (Na(+)-transporting) subunit B [Flavobacteriales bacterium]